MKVSEIAKILNADILYGEDLINTVDVKSAFASDMMSDVLAFVVNEGVLLTGLVNPQVVRTAEMMDMPCICFCRGKMPDKATIDLAKQYNIILLFTKSMLFLACGELYKNGLNAGG